MKFAAANRTGRESFGICRARRGSLMVEMVVCTILLSVIMLVLAPGLIAVQRQRQATKFDTLTLIELNNIATRFHAGAIPDAVELSPWFVQRYKHAKLKITAVDVSADDPASVPTLQIRISQPAVNGYPETERSLVIWTTEGGE